MAQRDAVQGEAGSTTTGGQPSPVGRAALVLAVIAVLTLTASTWLNIGASVFLGKNDGDRTSATASHGRQVPGSVPQPGQPGPEAAQPTVAITFDDGIDPRYTPAILDVLARYEVPATFFLIGERIPGHEKVLQRMIEDGHELALHSYNHSRMGGLDDEEVRRQYLMTQQLIIGATGLAPTIGRPPYSFDAEGLAEDEWRAAMVAQETGFTMIFTDIGPPDFIPGIPPAEIAAASVPDQDDNYILTLHDGGGNRQATVDALPSIIEELQDRNYRFQTASRYGGLPDPARPGLFDRLAAWALLATTAPYRFLTSIVSPTILGLTALLLLRYLASLLMAITERLKENRILTGRHEPPVSVIVPVFNEEVGVEATLHSLLDSVYSGELEIIVVDDGSTDRTADIAESIPGVQVVRKENGGKASALNAGVAASQHELCVLIDGDTVFGPDTVSALAAEFADPKVGAVSGYPMVGNPHNLLTQLQYLEYVVGSGIERRFQNRLGVIYCIPGAVGAFRRWVLLNAGGLKPVTLAEDTDLTVTIGSMGLRIAHAPLAVAYTEAPSTLKVLWKQRLRWGYGMLQVAWKHRKKSIDAENSPYRRFVVWYLVLMNVILPLIAPIVDFFAITAIVSGERVALFAALYLTMSLQSLAAAVALKLDGRSGRYLVFAIPQAFFFRYFNCLIAAAALIYALAGSEQAWNKPKRIGMGTGPYPADSRRAGELVEAGR